MIEGSLNSIISLYPTDVATDLKLYIIKMKKYAHHFVASLKNIFLADETEMMILFSTFFML